MLLNTELPDNFNQSLFKNFKSESDDIENFMKIILPKFVNHKKPNEGDRIVYCFGKFDLLHPGHI